MENKPKLILLFDGAPSVPRETQTPASSSSCTGEKPSILKLDAGQWDTFTDVFAMSSTYIYMWNMLKWVIY